MANKDWKTYLDEAIKAKIESERCLDFSVRSLMSLKGFTTEQVLLFEACFAGGQETVISFNRECEDADLDIKIAAEMTKVEIIKRLSRDASDETIKLLRGERI